MFRHPHAWRGRDCSLTSRLELLSLGAKSPVDGLLGEDGTLTPGETVARTNSLAASSEPQPPAIEPQSRIGGILFFTAGVVIMVSMAVTELGWTSPYSLVNNAISDLGSVHCSFAYGGTHYSCSPWHDVFNAGIILMGLLVIAGATLGWRTFPGRKLRVMGWILLVVLGIGAIGIGLFPWDAGNFKAHQIAGLGVFVGGNLGLMTLGFAMDRDPKWGKFRAFSVILGVVGVMAFLAWIVQISAANNDFPSGGGVLERISAGTIILWLFVIGVDLARRRGHAFRATDTNRGDQTGSPS
jgi:hypothetical membrane protein